MSVFQASRCLTTGNLSDSVRFRSGTGYIHTFLASFVTRFLGRPDLPQVPLFAAFDRARLVPYATHGKESA